VFFSVQDVHLYQDNHHLKKHLFFLMMSSCNIYGMESCTEQSENAKISKAAFQG